ncbi:MAG: hypothetical protein AAGC49_01045 [Brevundimonas sp.]
MTTTHAAEANDRQDERKRKRGAVIKFSLAGAALLGIAAAATSAAWTDDAWFKADAHAASIELSGLDFTSGDFVPADDDSAAIQIPASELDNLVPNETRTFDISIKNESQVALNVASSIHRDGALFGDANVTSVLTGAPTTLAVDAEAVVTVTVHTPANWDSAYAGSNGALSITFTGTTQH